MRRTVVAALLAVAGLGVLAPDGRTAVLSAQSEARTAMAAQAEALGVAGGVVSVPRHASLSDAVRAFVGSKQALTPAAESTIGELADVPAELDAPLARVVDAFIAFDAAAAARAAVAGEDMKAGLGDVLAARVALFDAVSALPSGTSVRTPRRAAPFQVLPWFSLSLGKFHDTYDTDVVLLIDDGGNDQYFNNAGGSSLHDNMPSCELGAVIPSPAAAAIDLEGFDWYETVRACGINGGGSGLGAGFLYDGGIGRDSYTAAGFGVNGGGNFGGVGFLYDEAGDSEFWAGASGVNGGGALGVGLLVDGGGDDLYSGLDSGVNGGAQLGAGSLVDSVGHDEYYGGSFGVNGGANGGVGSLVDRSGNDFYGAGGSGANGSGSAGVGLLLDGGGFDRYSDSDGGSGTNVTVPVKGAVGSQLDLPL